MPRAPLSLCAARIEPGRLGIRPSALHSRYSLHGEGGGGGGEKVGGGRGERKGDSWKPA